MVFIAVDAQRRGLLAALVAAGRLARGHRRDQPLGERQAWAPAKGAALASITSGPASMLPATLKSSSSTMAAPLDAALAGVGGRRAACAEQVQLALGAARVGVGQGAGDVGRRPALGEQVEAGRPVERIEQRLARDRADAAPGVRAQGADREKAAGDRDAEPAFVVAPEDGPCHAEA